MTEISKIFKIFLIVTGAVALFYGIWWTFFFDTYYTMVAGLYYDPGSLRGQGGTLILLGIFNILAAWRIGWEKMQYYLQFGLSWLIIMLILNIVNLFDPLMSSGAIMIVWINIAILSVFIVLLIYLYLQQTKKS